MIEALEQAAAEKVVAAERKRDGLAAEVDLYRRGLLLPSAETLDKVRRYETGLERSMYKALHELQRLQAARSGQMVPPPAVVDVHGMDDSDARN